MRRMYEFDSVSVSSYEAGSLVDHLSAKSADGWDVVAIVPAGTDVVAYLRRDQPAADAPDAAVDAGTSAADGSVDSASPGDTTSAAATAPDATAATTSAAGWGASGVTSSSPSETTTTGASSWDSGSGAATRGWADRNSSRRRPARRRPRRRRRCRPAGTPTPPAASSCATGTARPGPSTCRAPASSSPTRPSPDRPATPSLLTAVPGPCAPPRSATPASSSRPPTASILCDPWFVPAFFGSWFVFPRNDQLDAGPAGAHRAAPTTCTSPTSTPTTSTSRGCADHVPRDIPSCSPATRPASWSAAARARLHRARPHDVDGEELDLGGLTVAIHVETRSPTAPAATRRSSSATARRASSTRTTAAPPTSTRCAPTARSTCTGCSTAGRSGTRWSTTLDRATMRALVDAKVDSQFARAMRYVEAVGARAVVPSAGPPCFLDPELFRLNVITGDELSIFPDQRSVPRAPRRPPATTASWRSPARRSTSTPTAIDRHPPVADDEVDAIFDRQGRATCASTRPTGCRGSPSCRRRWDRAERATCSPRCKAWWEPLLAMAPDAARGHRRPGAAACSRRRRPRDPRSTSPPARCAPTPASPTASASTSHRELVETVVAERAVDWSNALFLSCRFRAWREGEFNEYLYNFFKSLSVGAHAPHRGRGASASSTRRPRPSPTSSSATTSSSAAARTATPTWPCSARSTAAS